MHNRLLKTKCIFAMQMQKILTILLSIFYFGMSSGAVFSAHYCMDELVSFSQDPGRSCTVCGAEKKDDCCKTEFKILKTDQSQKSEITQLTTIFLFFEPKKVVFSFPFPSFFPEKWASTPINAPPEIGLTPIFIQHCNFRI